MRCLSPASWTARQLGHVGSRSTPVVRLPSRSARKFCRATFAPVRVCHRGRRVSASLPAPGAEQDRRSWTAASAWAIASTAPAPTGGAVLGTGGVAGSPPSPTRTSAAGSASPPGPRGRSRVAIASTASCEMCVVLSSCGPQPETCGDALVSAARGASDWTCELRGRRRCDHGAPGAPCRL